MVEMRLPTAVRPGDAISVLAPASFASPDRIEGGLAALNALGYPPHLGAHTLARGPLFFAGTPEERIADLHTAFADESTSFLSAIRGGYGSNYILDKLDLDLIGNYPKPFLAYSDLTAMQLFLLDRIGLPAFHGPMVAADFYLKDGVHLPSLQAALTGKPYNLGPAEGLRILKPGSAKGTLYGGCLSIITATLGTPYEPKTEGKLLFLEDTGAKPYQIDRMLWQLRAAGKFEGVTGIIFGEMLDCASPGAPPELLQDVLLHFFRDFHGPIAIGLRSGHVSTSNVTLTFGVAAELNTTATTVELKLLEPAVKA